MPKVFISYSHKDEAWKNRLQTQLDVLQMQGLLSVWDDRQIQVGDLWLPKIEQALNDADVAILLISADFLSSRFILEKEVPQLLARREKAGLLIVPLILKPCLWRTVVWLNALQGATRDNIELSALPEHQQDEALCKLAEKIHDLLNTASARPGNASDPVAKQIFTDMSQISPAADAASRPLPCKDIQQQRLANRLLDSSPVFYQALLQDFINENPDKSAPASAADCVQYFAHCPTEEIPMLFYWVRRALLALPTTLQEPRLKKQAEEAAAALYCLAAIQLVNHKAHEAGNNRVQVPRSENILCAIIATALFGGELRLLPADEPGLPRPEYVFSVQVPAVGDEIVAGFERAVYTTLFQNARTTPTAALDCHPLNEQEIQALAARFRSIKYVKRAGLALVIQGINDDSVCQPFADKYQVPLLFPRNQATTALLGMDAGDLLAEIREFWSELDALRLQQSV